VKGCRIHQCGLFSSLVVTNFCKWKLQKEKRNTQLFLRLGPECMVISLLSHVCMESVTTIRTRNRVFPHEKPWEMWQSGLRAHVNITKVKYLPLNRKFKHGKRTRKFFVFWGRGDQSVLGDQILREKKNWWNRCSSLGFTQTARCFDDSSIQRGKDFWLCDGFFSKKKIGYMPCYLINPEKVRNTC
jgi:hypothetical protein